MTNEFDPLQAQFDAIPVPCYTWRFAGGEWTLERANQAAFAMAGERLRELIGGTVRQIFPDRPDLREDLEHVRASGRTYRREYEHVLAASGVARRLDVHYVPIGPDAVLCHADDVTELRATEARLRAVIATVESGLLTIGPAGQVVDVNPAACAILGIPREQLMTDPAWWEAVRLRYADGSPLTPGDPGTPGVRALREGQPVRDVSLRISRPDGAEVQVSANYTPLNSGTDGAITGMVVSISDVTEALRLQDRVAHQALHDPLTGLPNRLLFQERLEQALARPQRERMSVLLIGLDRFRAVNDTHGHTAGDEVLIEVATRLHQVLDVAQPLARVGGDEFAVLAECEDERDAAELADRLARALDPPLETGLQVSAAIGIAIEEPGHDGVNLVQGADAAMQRVKGRGGNAFEIFDRAMAGRLRDRLRIEDGLRRAIAQDELRLVYQPILAVDTLRTVALEALVRWQHPEQGLLGPGHFLPVAEQNVRLISAIGDWVLHRACLESRLFPDGVRISVNVAARELSEAGFRQRIARTLAHTGTPPSRITLEITETTLMEGGDAAIAGLVELAQLGLNVHLDDFGTGYSSLTRLATLPLNGIKLDRGFVARATDDRDRRIIEAAVSIGRAAGLPVVAEGIETEDQLELVRAAGCAFVQGFLLGRPELPEQVIPTLT
ncbi:EAL domain-containing protein [Solirubrobacter taibaiensis]|nr:EAL domain-containing protein [Solirubrobacter taibaiensis]